MRKRIGILLLSAGFIFVATAGYKLLFHHISQKQAIHTAEASVMGISRNKEAQSSENTRESFHPVKGELIGILKIPEIDMKLPIVEGTDSGQLARGVGHYSATVFPGGHDQVLLSGHRDTVFGRLGELEIGDKIIVQLPYDTFKYVMKGSEIVSADDTTVIHSTAPKETLTLSTCYPFNYVGNAPKRYVIYAYPDGL